MKHLEAIVSRTNVSRDIQFSAKYDAFHESASYAIGLSACCRRGQDNFKENYSPAVGAVVSRSLGTVAEVYASPIWAHNTFPNRRDPEHVLPGLGTRIRIVPSLFVVVEGSPRLSGYTRAMPSLPSRSKSESARTFSP